MNTFALTPRHHGGPDTRFPDPRNAACGLVALPLLFLAIVSCGTPAPYGPGTDAQQPVAPVASVPVDQFVGEWEGVYYAHPHPMGIALTLREAGPTAVEGEVHFYPLRESRSVFRAAEGRFSVRGSYDPVLRTYDLMPVAWIERPTQGVTPFRFQGVLDPFQPALGGVFSTRPGQAGPFYSLARPQQADDLRRRALLNGGRFRVGRTPGDDALVRWASRLTEEHPDVDPQRTEQRRLFTLASNLFEDGYFREHFGTTFDQLSAREMGSVQGRFARTTRLSTARPGTLKSLLERSPNEELREFRALRRAFDGSVSPGAMDVVTMVLSQRVMRAWREGQLARAHTLAPTPGAINDLDRLRAAGEANLATLWPSEQAAFASTVADRQRELAVPVLRASADEVVSGAEGYEGAGRLASWPMQNNRLLSLVPPGEREIALARVTGRLDEILQPLVAPDAAVLNRLGHGVEAVLAGNAWYREYRRRWDFAAGRPAVREPLERFRSMRAHHLAEAQDDLVAVILGARTHAEVDELLAEILAVPGDRATPAGTAILAASEDQKVVIRREAFRPLIGFISGLVALECHLELTDPEHERHVGASALLRICRRSLGEIAVRAALPESSHAEVAAVTDLVLDLLDGRILDRRSMADRLVQDLRARHPDRPWTVPAAEALIETVERQIGRR